MHLYDILWNWWTLKRKIEKQKRWSHLSKLFCKWRNLVTKACNFGTAVQFHFVPLWIPMEHQTFIPFLATGKEKWKWKKYFRWSYFDVGMKFSELLILLIKPWLFIINLSTNANSDHYKRNSKSLDPVVKILVFPSHPGMSFSLFS